MIYILSNQFSIIYFKPKCLKLLNLPQKEERFLVMIIYLWHLRLGHINLDRIERLIKDGPLRELRVGTLPVCESCLEGKMTKRAFSAKGEREKAPLEIIRSDVCGPLNVKAKGGYEYFVIFIDDYSRYGYAYLMHKKSRFLKSLKNYVLK